MKFAKQPLFAAPAHLQSRLVCDNFCHPRAGPALFHHRALIRSGQLCSPSQNLRLGCITTTLLFLLAHGRRPKSCVYIPSTKSGFSPGRQSRATPGRWVRRPTLIEPATHSCHFSIAPSTTFATAVLSYRDQKS